MKKIDISRMERLRSINLRVGYALALLLAVAAFAWTSERPLLPADETGDAPGEAEINMIRTAQPPPALKPPVSRFTLADKIVEVPEVTFSTLPVTIPAEPAILTKQPAALAGTYSESSPVVLPKPKEPEADPFFRIVEEMPRFPGCEDQDLTKKEKENCATSRLLHFLGKNLRYPAIARENGIDGTVVIRFIVERDGSISNAQVVRDIGGGCGEEALRVVNSMPPWQPGLQQGRPVRVRFNLPVKFSLQ